MDVRQTDKADDDRTFVMISVDRTDAIIVWIFVYTYLRDIMYVELWSGRQL